MSYSQLVKDYLGQGTHASRPVTPNVATGVNPFYYETDTTTLFFWNGSAWQAAGAETPSNAALEAAVLADSPVHYWPCQDAALSTSAVDVGPHSLSLAPQDGSTTFANASGLADANCAFLPGGGGLKLTTTSHLPISGDMTLEAWIQRANSGTGNLQVGYWGDYGGNGVYGLRFQGNHEVFTWGFNSNTGFDDTDTPFIGGFFHHVVLAYDHTKGFRPCYMDAVPVADEYPGTAASLTATECYFGATDPGGSDHAALNIMHIAVYASALPYERVLAHYRALLG